ncbi:unnamed protein product [Ectocarpus fasciculatus]
MKIKVLSLTKDEMIFDLMGVDASIANALRRILIAEVPTMAIEHVYIQQNTSIIQDEVLAHRLGLIPIDADARQFDMIGEDDEATDLNTLVFKLDVSCTNADFADPNAPVATSGPETKHVYSGDMEWQPQGLQQERFPEGITPVEGDILVAALRAGQQIQVEVHCVKGIGKDHAKFSPCATASYRLLPEIRFLKPVQRERATELKNMCPLGVFDIEDMGGVPTAVTARPRDCTMCRECTRTKDWADYVELRRVANHFIFSVESTGAMSPDVLVQEAIRILRKKATDFKTLAGQEA